MVATGDPRKSREYQQAADRFLRARPLVCHWCGVSVLRTVPAGHPNKATVDHLVEVDMRPDAALDATLWVVACWTCNTSRGATYRHRRNAVSVVDRKRPASRDW